MRSILEVSEPFHLFTTSHEHLLYLSQRLKYFLFRCIQAEENYYAWVSATFIFCSSIRDIGHFCYCKLIFRISLCCIANLEGWSATHSYWCLQCCASPNNPSTIPSTNRKGLICSSRNPVSKRQQCSSAKGTDKRKLIYRSLRTQNLRDAPDFCA